MSDLRLPKQWKAVQQDWDVVEQFDNVATNIVCLTQREQNILLSALQVVKWRTRWVNLPDEQDLDFVDDLESKLMCSGCCDAVAGCLENPEIITIIEEILRGGGQQGNRRGTGLPSLDNCHPDAVFGAITQLVQYLIDSSRDAFEIIEVATNRAEVISEWLDNFNISLPVISIIADYVSWIQDSIAENFDANLTVALQDEYRCDLFCLWMDNCNGLSASDISGYFLDRIGGVGLLGTLEDLLNFLVSGSWSGTQIVDAMLAGCIGIMSVDLDWVPFITIPSLYTLDTVLALGANNPDPDWSILCTDCPQVWCYQWLNGAGFSPAWAFVEHGGGFATYNSGLDRVDGYVNPTPNTGAFVDMRLSPIGADVSIIHIECPYNATRATTNDFVRLYVNGELEFDTELPVGAGVVIEDIEVNGVVNSVWLLMAVGMENSSDGGYARVQEIRFSGTSTPPFGPSNCLED